MRQKRENSLRKTYFLTIKDVFGGALVLVNFKEIYIFFVLLFLFNFQAHLLIEQFSHHDSFNSLLPGGNKKVAHT